MNPFLVSENYIKYLFSTLKFNFYEKIKASLAALVHQHSLTPLALPIKLILPTKDLVQDDQAKSPTVEEQSSSSNAPQSPTQIGSLTPEARVLLEKGAGMYQFKIIPYTIIKIENYYFNKF